ncbi:nicotianamine synthase, S-adenosyl-L-methionine-dependent methyltransferase [Tanacetum coccineum]
MISKTDDIVNDMKIRNVTFASNGVFKRHSQVQVQEESILIEKVCQIYEQLSKLETLKPSKDVDNLFTQLVHACIPHSSINIATLPPNIQEIRSKLIRLCGEAEGLLEAHFSTILGSFKNPLHHLNIFPYYSNYLKLGRLEYDILNKHYSTTTQKTPKRVAFVGSGPLPFTSIVLASYHLKDTTFHNYDIDSMANSMASRLVSADHDLSKRMVFHTADIMDVTDDLKNYDVIFLAALVGMNIEDKNKVIQHLAKYMAPGAILMLRSAHGARAFLYPVVDPNALHGFDVLSIFHPDDDVINSVVISRKFVEPVNIDNDYHALDIGSLMASSCKYCDIQPFNHPLGHMKMIDESMILGYVCGTLDYGLELYFSSTSSLVAYSDAHWARCQTTRRSTLGYCVFVGNNLLSWSFKRQYTLSRSNAEAEYRGVANAVFIYLPIQCSINARSMSGIDIHFVRDQVATRQFDPNALHGFNVLSIFHPGDDFINSIVISRKFVEPVNIDNKYHDLDIGSLMASSS